MAWDRYLNLIWYWLVHNLTSEDREKLEASFRELETEDKISRVKRDIANLPAPTMHTDVERRRAAMEKAKPKNWGSDEMVTAQNFAAAQALRSGGGDSG